MAGVRAKWAYHGDFRWAITFVTSNGRRVRFDHPAIDARQLGPREPEKVLSGRRGAHVAVRACEFFAQASWIAPFRRELLGRYRIAIDRDPLGERVQVWLG